MSQSKFEWSNPLFWLSIAIAGLAIAQVMAPSPVLMAPSPYNKLEQAYRRNGFGDKIMSIDRRAELSSCYKEMLRNNGYDEVKPTPKAGTHSNKPESFEGKLTFVFHVDEDGSLLKFELADSDFQDKNFSNCIAKTFDGLRFLPPPLGINRYLAHEFIFKTDDTFKREMEERKNQAPLTLFTATPEPVPN